MQDDTDTHRHVHEHVHERQQESTRLMFERHRAAEMTMHAANREWAKHAKKELKRVRRMHKNSVKAAKKAGCAEARLESMKARHKREEKDIKQTIHKQTMKNRANEAKRFALNRVDEGCKAVHNWTQRHS